MQACAHKQESELSAELCMLLLVHPHSSCVTYTRHLAEVGDVAAAAVAMQRAEGLTASMYRCV